MRGNLMTQKSMRKLLEKHMLEINNFNEEEYLPELSFLVKKTLCRTSLLLRNSIKSFCS